MPVRLASAYQLVLLLVEVMAMRCLDLKAFLRE
jgi:hypothetical protein